MNKIIAPLTALIAGICLIVTGLIVTTTWKQNRSLNQTVAVTGSAKRTIKADLAFVTGGVTATSDTRATAYAELKRQMALVLTGLKSKGFTGDAVELSPSSTSVIYDQTPEGVATNVIRGYSSSQTFAVRGNDVVKIKELSLSLNDLVNQDIALSVNAPRFLFTKLGDLKITMQAEATKDATKRARKILEATGRALGDLRDASMGVIQVTPKDSSTYEEGGSLDETSIDKDVTAVARLSFNIK